MNEDKKYNGWTNYETWNLKLWIDNEQFSQEFWAQNAQAAYDGAASDLTFTRVENAAHSLREQLKEYYEQEYCDVMEQAKIGASWISDFIGAAFSEVNFHEIAESLLADVELEEAVPA